MNRKPILNSLAVLVVGVLFTVGNAVPVPARGNAGDIAGSYLAASTVAEPDGDGFRVNGTKTFSTDGPAADLAVAYAVTDPEPGPTTEEGTK